MKNVTQVKPDIRVNMLLSSDLHKLFGLQLDK